MSLLNRCFNRRSNMQKIKHAPATYTSERSSTRETVSIDTPTYDNAPNNEQANNYHCDEKWFHGNLLLKSYLQTTWFWKGKIPHGSEIDVLKGSVHEKYS